MTPRRAETLPLREWRASQETTIAVTDFEVGDFRESVCRLNS